MNPMIPYITATKQIIRPIKITAMTKDRIYRKMKLIIFSITPCGFLNGVELLAFSISLDSLSTNKVNDNTMNNPGTLFKKSKRAF